MVGRSCSQAFLAETLETDDKNANDFPCTQMSLVMSMAFNFGDDWNNVRNHAKSLVQVLKDTNKKARNDFSSTSRFTFEIVFCLSAKQTENMTFVFQYFKAISMHPLNQEIKDTLGSY